MLKHYTLVAIRNLARNKVFSLINILGLAVGMGICLIIYQYIHFELSYDQFHKGAENTYRLTQTVTRGGEEQGTGVFTTFSLGEKAKADVPELDKVVRVCPFGMGLVVANTENEKVFQEDKLLYADKDFLQLFSFPLKWGNRSDALKEKHNVVLSAEAANRYFGEDNPIGKALKVSGGSLSGEFIVAGVLETLPANSHLQFDVLFPMGFILDNWRLFKEDNGWERSDFVTYASLHEGADPAQVAPKLNRVVATYAGKALAERREKWQIGLQPITDIHLYSSFAVDPAHNPGSLLNIKAFALIAVFVLLMAWVNYINLSTAHALNRAKEVGVRKTIGVVKSQLVSQFMLESLLINVVAGALAVCIATFMLPILNSIIDKELQLLILQEGTFWLGFVGLLLLGALLSGLYPAFVLSSFKPVKVFSAGKIIEEGGINLRKGLIVFQFMMSVLLIAATYLVYGQISYMKNKNLGVDMKKILVVNGPRVILEEENLDLVAKYNTFKNEAGRHATVASVSATSSIPGKGYTWSDAFRKSGAPEGAEKEVSMVMVDADFANTYQFNFLAGGNFQDEMAEQEWVIMNEEALTLFGYHNPQEAVGQKLRMTDGEEAFTIAGVVKNTHWSSLKEAQSPVLFVNDNGYGAFFSLHVNLADIPATITHLKKSYKAVFPNDPFDFFFLEDDFNRQYQADLQFGKLFSAFSVLAIFIACLGLFGLVSYSASLRLKEIGIRKVLGASISNLMLLLSKEYLLLLLLANVLALPILLWGAKAWLDNYAYRISISAEMILVPGLVLFVVSLLTVSYQTYRSAKANPAHALRKE